MEVSLYCWPPVWLVWISLFCKWKQKLSVVIQLIPNQSNRRSTVQWSPFSIPWSNTLAFCTKLWITLQESFITLAAEIRKEGDVVGLSGRDVGRLRSSGNFQNSRDSCSYDCSKSNDGHHRGILHAFSNYLCKHSFSFVKKRGHCGLGNCNEFYFNFKFKYRMWVHIYQKFEKHRILICHFSSIHRVNIVHDTQWS